MPDASVIIISTPEAVIIKITGEMRLNVEAIERQLDGVMVAKPHRVVLDLCDLSFMSSLGMGVILTLNRTIQRHGGKVVLAGVQPQVEGSFRFTRLTDLIKPYPTVEDALAGQ